MRWAIVVLALAQPASAQDRDPLGFLAEGLARLLDDLVIELGPSLEAMQGWVDDFGAYELPEVLPNGDIIIRRKPAAPAPEEATPPEGIDL